MLQIRPTILLLAASAPLVAGSLAEAQDDAPTPEELDFFESKIRPVLIESCYECHSDDGGRRRGGLSVDSRDALLFGGETGPAVVPGDLEASLLWEAITYAGYEMPPEGPLPAGVIDDFRRWIEMGAPDPRVPEVAVVKSGVSPEDIEAARAHWSFQPPQRGAAPAVRDESWPRSPIDHHILARLDAEGMKPAPDAKPEELLRRITFDLIGLQPTADQRERFDAAWRKDREQAIADMVDELLASPLYGERWGRHWLDVARYAESTGKELNATYSEAWRYRDYVIDAFNADKPYDQFVREQIAGDLLPADDDAEWAEHLVATGFLALGAKSLTEDDPRLFRANLVDEQIDTTTRAILGLSVACARCHDHKFEAIPQTDYYALAGVFGSTETYFGTLEVRQNRRSAPLLSLPIDDPNPFTEPLSRYEREELEIELAQRRDDYRGALANRRMMRREGGSMTGDSMMSDLTNVARSSFEVALIEERLRSVDAQGNPRSLCMGVQDGEPQDARVFLRGEVDQPAQEVPRGLVQVLSKEQPAMPADQSGRLELSRWLTSADNPLTARVMANRVWLHLFGEGIVRSPEDFGSTGRAPTHPELLDHLALELMESGWSIKALIREIMLSRAYRMSAKHDRGDFKRDPENELLWRATPRRLEAEAIRDAMLAASGELDLERPPASDVARAGHLVVTRRTVDAVNALTLDPVHRSVYLPIVRDAVPASLAAFDFAEPTLIVGQREQTSTPTQALYLMNSDFVIARSDALARLVMQAESSRRARVRLAVERVYGRKATGDEVDSGAAFLKSFPREDGANELVSLSAFCQALFASAEFRFID